MSERESTSVKLSFVMPAYKSAFLKQAIDSIVSQTYKNWELVVIDDASPEDLESIVRQHDDSRITYHRNSENIGGRSLVEQWNHSISFANGDYLALAADDDLYAPTFAENCLALAEKYPQVDLIRTRVRQIDENGNEAGGDAIMPEFLSRYGYVYYFMTGQSFTCIGNLLFKTSVIKEKGFIDLPCAFGSDTVSTIMMAYNGVANTKSQLFSFRHSSIHLSGSQSQTHLAEKFEAITKEFKYISSLNYPEPDNEVDAEYARSFIPERIREKKRYDYFNLVIKYLPVSQLGYIRKCDLPERDKFIMLLRYFYNRFFKR